jgi:hypothetical protein
MIAEFKATVNKYERNGGTAYHPADGQVICWSDCPDEPNTWRVSEIQYEGNLPHAHNYQSMEVALPSTFYWFQMPRFVIQYNLLPDAGL